MQSLSLKTKFALLTTVVLWSSAFVGIRIGLNGYTPGALALFRFLMASMLMYLFVTQLPSRPRIGHKDKFLILCVGMLGIGLYNIALNGGEQTIPAGIASFIISQSPIFTIIFAVLFLGERLTWLGVGGISVSFIGIILIMLANTHLYVFNAGIFYMLLAMLVSAIYSLIQKPFLLKYHAIEVAAYIIWGGTLGLLFFIPDLYKELPHAPLNTTLTILYLAIFPAAIGYATWSMVLAEMPASRAVNFLFFMPIVSTLLGWLILNEVPHMLALLGGLIALLGVWIVNKSFRKAVKLPKDAIA